MLLCLHRAHHLAPLMCSQFRFEGLVTTTTSPPSVQSAPIYLIGGVFTPSPHRGSGHGGVMMRLLHEKLRPLTPNLLRTMSPAAAATAASPVSPRKDGSQYGNDAVCSVLWSDLETWYERNGGYKLKGWSDTVVSAVPAGTGEVESSDDEDVDYLSPEELPQRFAQLAKEDERLIREELEELATTTTTASSSSSSPNPIISLISNRGESWRYSSLQSQLQVRFQSRPMPTSWGCQLKSSPTTWAIWAYGLLPPSSGEASSLNVLRHRAENAESFFKLLQAARRAAARVEGCTRVVVWNVEDNSSPSSRYWPEAKARLEKEAGAKVWNEVRPTSRPAVAWYRDSGDDEDNDGVVRAQDAEPVRWINAEFGYCLAT